MLSRNSWTKKTQKKFHELFFDKGTAVLIGWLWNAAISASISIMLGKLRSPDVVTNDVSHDSRSRMISPVLAYFIGMLCVTMCEGLIKRQESSFFQPLIPAFALIPAWAFKDLVVDFMNWATDVTQANIRWLCAIGVLLVSVGLSCVLPKPDPDAFLCRKMLARLNGTMALGDGYAFNAVFQHISVRNWSKCGFQVVYTPLITILTCRFRSLMDVKLEKATNNMFQEKLYLTLKDVSQFCSAWAAQALLNATYEEWWSTPTNKGRNLVWNLCFTIILCFGVAAMSVIDMEGNLWTLMLAIGGVNIGWAWSNSASASIALSTENQTSATFELLVIWMHVAVATVFLPILLACLDRCFQLICWKEHFPPLTVEGVDKGSTVGPSTVGLPSRSVENLQETE